MEGAATDVRACLPVVPFCAAASLVSPLRLFWWLPVTPSVSVCRASTQRAMRAPLPRLLPLPFASPPKQCSTWTHISTTIAAAT